MIDNFMFLAYKFFDTKHYLIERSLNNEKLLFIIYPEPYNPRIPTAVDFFECMLSNIYDTIYCMKLYILIE